MSVERASIEIYCVIASALQGLKFYKDKERYILYLCFQYFTGLQGLSLYLYY